jgi:hypothetical protein
MTVTAFTDFDIGVVTGGSKVTGGGFGVLRVLGDI